MSQQEIKLSEMDNYDFGDPVAPEGFNPDSSGFIDPPPGEHKMTIEDATIVVNHVFKHKDIPGGQWMGNQIRPKLSVVGGEFAGRSILDFLPMPTKGKAMPAQLANQWANFIRGFGFKATSTELVPPGFTLKQLVKSVGMVSINKETYNGETKTKVKYFGYSPVTEAKSGEAPYQPAGSTTATSKPPAIDIDDL